MQVRIPFLFTTHTASASTNRSVVKAQWGVTQGGGIGVLWGRQLHCWTGADISGMASVQPTGEEEDALVMAQPDEPSAPFVNVGSLPAHDNLDAFMECALLPKVGCSAPTC